MAELKRVIGIPEVSFDENGNLIIKLPRRYAQNGWIGIGSKDRPWVPYTTDDGTTVLVSARAFIPQNE